MTVVALVGLLGGIVGGFIMRRILDALTTPKPTPFPTIQNATAPTAAELNAGVAS